MIVDSDGTTGGLEAIIRTSTMSGDASKDLDASPALAITANKIQSFTSTGFTLGTDPDVNENAGGTYFWVAMKAAPGVMKVGTYTGNGTNQAITGLGFAPVYVIVLPAAAQDAVQRSATMPPGFSEGFRSWAWNDAITSFHADGFVVGPNAAANANGGVYHYVAWASVPGSVTVGSYTGNNTDDRNIAGTGFLPEWVVVSRAWANGQTGAQGDAPVHHPFTIQRDSSLLLQIPNIAEDNHIQALQTDGFQVGTRTRVNSSTAPNAYHWAAFGPHTPPTNYRSIGNMATGVVAGGAGFTVTQGSTIVDGPTAHVAHPEAGPRRRDHHPVPGSPRRAPAACRTRSPPSSPRPAWSSPSPTRGRQRAAGQGSSAASSRASSRGRTASTGRGNGLHLLPAGTSTSLVSDDRSEVGIVYNDGTAYAGPLVIDGSTTDAAHTITLTVDAGNRHLGLPWSGSGATTDVVVNNARASSPAISIQDDYVTVEWLEVKGGSGAAAHGISIPGASVSNQINLRYNLVHDVGGNGVNVAWGAQRQPAAGEQHRPLDRRLRRVPQAPGPPVGGADPDLQQHRGVCQRAGRRAASRVSAAARRTSSSSTTSRRGPGTRRGSTTSFPDTDPSDSYPDIDPTSRRNTLGATAASTASTPAPWIRRTAPMPPSISRTSRRGTSTSTAPATPSTTGRT